MIKTSKKKRKKDSLPAPVDGLEPPGRISLGERKRMITAVAVVVAEVKGLAQTTNDF